MKSILITDSLFISKDNEKQLTDAGFEITRLDKPEATESELIEAIKGKDGYILGGIEKLTNKIIDSADNLKAIVFTGIGYKDFIQNHEYVTSKNIAIANTPDGPTHAVAEWALTTTLAMTRNIFELGNTGSKNFMTTKGIENQKVGIIGLGRIGQEITKMLKPFRPSEINYYSKNRKENIEATLGVNYLEMDQVLSISDIIYVCVSRDAGENFIDKDEISKIKDGALLVSTSPKEIISKDDIVPAINSGRVSAAFDYKLPETSNSNSYFSNNQTAFNTESSVKLISDMATQSMINLLDTGDDMNKVN